MLSIQGGEPDIITTAKRVLNDFQRGKLPYFVKPPALEEDSNADKSSNGTPPKEDTLEQVLCISLLYLEYNEKVPL